MYQFIRPSTFAHVQDLRMHEGNWIGGVFTEQLTNNGLFELSTCTEQNTFVFWLPVYMRMAFTKTSSRGLETF